MNQTTAALDPTADIADLTVALIDVESVSGNERGLADLVQVALTGSEHLTVDRFGNTVVARTELGRPERVVLAGHLDTVPVNDNLPASRTAEQIAGLGACDMKGGVAVGLRLAATVPAPERDVTYVFYDCEEVESERNGLGRLATARPDLLTAEFAVLMEPSGAQVEAGCQGTLRADVVLHGVRAHSARAWKGENAIHAAGGVLARLAAYEPARIEVDGLVYREGLNAIGIRGGVAGNVIPDECRVSVNYRFAPVRSQAEAFEHVQRVFGGYDVELVDSAPAAMPGLDRAVAKAFLTAVNAEPHPKLGWTDVARFNALDIPAVNYGPGDPSLAHTKDEYVEVRQLTTCEQRLRDWLGGGATTG